MDLANFQPFTAEEKPNIVLIMAVDHGNACPRRVNWSRTVSEFNRAVVKLVFSSLRVA